MWCTCKREETVTDPTKQCVLFTAEQYRKLHKRSFRYDEHAKQKDVNYSKNAHCNWCDVKNKSMIHFGINPDKLNIELLRFYVFHLRFGVVIFLYYFWTLTNRYDYGVQE